MQDVLLQVDYDDTEELVTELLEVPSPLARMPLLSAAAERDSRVARVERRATQRRITRITKRIVVLHVHTDFATTYKIRQNTSLLR